MFSISLTKRGVTSHRFPLGSIPESGKIIKLILSRIQRRATKSSNATVMPGKNRIDRQVGSLF